MVGHLDRLEAIVHAPTFGKLGARDLRVLMVLLSHCCTASSDGSCWPSVTRIAAMANVDQRDTRRALRRLEVAGLIEVEPARGRSTRRYRIAPNATVEGGDSTLGSAPPSRSVEGGDSPRRGGSFAPVEGGESPSLNIEPKNLAARALSLGIDMDDSEDFHRRVSEFIGDGGTARDWDVLLRIAGRSEPQHREIVMLDLLSGPCRWRSAVQDARRPNLLQGASRGSRLRPLRGGSR